jgi:RNA polymerase sigma factor (sigma-70 family)
VTRKHLDSKLQPSKDLVPSLAPITDSGVNKSRSIDVVAVSSMSRRAKQFEEIYDACFTDLFRFVLANTRNRADCEEIVQEAFLRLYSNLDTVKAPRAWLFRCAGNLVVDGFRRRPEAAELPEGNPSGAASPEMLVRNRERRTKVLAAIESLADTQRHCLTLREYGGFSYREIAETLNLSVDEVKVHIFRARRRLQQALEEIRDELS